MITETRTTSEASLKVGRAIKIFHLIGSLERRGGTEEGMMMTIPRLSRDRFVNVVCSITNLMPSTKAEYQAQEIRAHTLGAKGKWDLRAVRRLLKLLQAERPDVLHCYLFHSNILGRIAGSLARVPVVVSSERSIDHHSRSGIILNRLTSSLVTAVETNSEAGKEFVIRKLKFDPNDVFVIHGGVEETNHSETERGRIRRSLGLTERSLVVGYIGRLHQAKGVSFLVEAFASVIVTHPDANMVIAGEGEERNQLQQLAKNMGLQSRILFLGHRSDVKAIMSGLDVLALPSLRESLPRVLLEGMMMSKPVVATRVGGVSEAVVDGLTGLLVSPGKQKPLADAISKILSDKKTASEMGREASMRARELFTLDKAASRYSCFYNQLA